MDLASGRGRIALELDVGLTGTDGTYAARWTRTEVEASLGAERERVSREHARASGGLLGRLPDELPRRIVLTLRLEPVSRDGQSVLPERTFTLTYDLKRFGEPVTGLDFESQAG